MIKEGNFSWKCIDTSGEIKQEEKEKERDSMCEETKGGARRKRSGKPAIIEGTLSDTASVLRG